MSEPILVDKSRVPGDADLARALGAAKPHWDALIGVVRERCPDATHEWKHYGAKYGWQLRVVFRKKALIYLIPHHGNFNAALALRPPAVAALRGAGLPEDLVREIESAKDAPEGRPARVNVAKKNDVAIVAKLISLKMGS